MVFEQLDKQFVQPELKKHSQLVGTSHLHTACYKLTVQQLEAHLTKMGAGWFAGGEQLTSADYMMSFPLEGLVSADPQNIGPKATEYVERIQGRYVHFRFL